MIPVALLLVAQAETPTPPDDIVVTARRRDQIKRLRLTTKRDRTTGVVTCRFRRRSGDAAFDALMCDAVRGCIPMVKTEADMRACVTPTLEAFVAKSIR